MIPPEVTGYLDANAARFVEELKEFLRIPSISTSSEHSGDIRRAAEFVAGCLRRMGVEATLEETGGHPAVVGSWLGARRAPTVLVYGHYDVQPADRRDGWDSAPFDPVERDGDLYARGATDDKGQILTHLKAAEAWLQSVGHAPCNLKFLIEGEEEVASKHLHGFIERNKGRLACDVVVLSDTPQFAAGVPAITYGLRGVAYYQIDVRGPSQDLHSGIFGGSVANPANALARLLGELVDADGVIRLPGFYDDVLAPEPWERDRFAALPFDEPAYLKQLGVSAPFGEEGYSTLERRWARPTCDVNGLWGGYAAEGTKTIIPHGAGAKLSFRLVPNQDPARISRSLRSFLQERLPPGLRMDVEEFDARPGILFPTDTPHMRAAIQAIEAGFGTRPVFVREGSSVPVVNSFKQLLGADSLLLGWGLLENNVHGPNEKIRLVDFHAGTRTSAHLLHELACGTPP